MGSAKVSQKDTENQALPFTGERFTPECVREIWYEHMHRYAVAASLCAGKQVLDAACGEGYGSAILAARAASVTGLDIDPEAVAHARERYAALSGLSFEQGDCAQLPFEDDSFDRVVSFETLEHLEAQEAMLSEFRRVLKADGLLVISSPDKAVYTEQQGNDNPFHVRELYREELETLLHEQFPAVRLLGQKLLFQSAIWSLDPAPGVRLQQQAPDGAVHEGEQMPHAPVYFIALCAAEPELLPALPSGLWLFDDVEESVYAHYYQEIRRCMAADVMLVEQNEEIARLRAALDAARQETGQGASWLRRLFRRS